MENILYTNQRKDNWHRDITNVSNWLMPMLTFLVALVALIMTFVYSDRTSRIENNYRDNTNQHKNTVNATIDSTKK